MKNSKKLFVTAGGVIYLFFALFHSSFWLLFGRDNVLSKIPPMLSKILQMLNIGIIALFIALGIILIKYRSHIVESPIGKSLLVLSAFFFIVRIVAEFIFPDCSYGLVVFLAACTAVYTIPLLKSNS
jgi:hypothetical protein